MKQLELLYNLLHPELNNLLHPEPKRHLNLLLEIPKKLEQRFYGHLIQYHQVILIIVAPIYINCSKVSSLTVKL